MSYYVNFFAENRKKYETNMNTMILFLAGLAAYLKTSFLNYCSFVIIYPFTNQILDIIIH